MTRVALAAPHTAAIDAGRVALAAGGNAIDAALAAAAALTVVYPHQCSLGGDLVALVRRPDGTVESVLSVGAAPAAVDVDAMTALGAVPGQGALAVTVPGVVAGWVALAAAGARLPLATPLAAAAALAREGAPVSAGLARALRHRRDAVLADPGLRGVLAPEGEVLDEGDTLVQPALAATLDALAAEPDDIYRGAAAGSLAAFLSAGGSAMTEADFASHRVEAGAPLTRDVSGARWHVAPPPSQGAVLLGLLPEAYAAAEEPDASGELVHAAIAARAARTAVLGDPRGGTIDIDRLLAPCDAHAAEEPVRGPRPLGDTVAVVAADADGTVVTLIQSVYQSFGAGVLDPATGIVLHNRGAAFAVAPGHPARIGPGLRPPHTLLPAIVETDDAVLGIGCQGGPSQPWILAQVAPALLDGAADPAEVLARPRWIVGERDLGRDRLTLVTEPGARPAAVAAADAGIVHAAADGLIDEAGHVQAVRLHPDGSLDGATDPRADGGLLTYPHSERTPR